MMAAAIVTATEPYLLSKNSWQNYGKTTAKSSASVQATGFHLDRTSVNTDRDWFDRNRSD